MSDTPRIAIVGAGIAGLRVAQRLSNVADISVFEKSRGIGGRMSTRRSGPFQFDHGAQYFTVRGVRFRNFLEPYLRDGTVRTWDALSVHFDAVDCRARETTEPRYIAVPGMTALCKEMAQDIDVSRDCRVQKLGFADGFWQVHLTDGTYQGGFDWVVSTAPAVQTAELMPDLTDWSSIKMQGCYSLMLGYEDGTSLPFDAATAENNPIAWIANNSSKPARTGPSAILIQSNPDWADDRIEMDQAEVQKQLESALAVLVDIDATTADYASLHRWRYARVTRAAASPYLLDTQSRLGACGDWCTAGRVEAAFDSAEALADAVLNNLSRGVA